MNKGQDNNMIIMKDKITTYDYDKGQDNNIWLWKRTR